MPKIVKTEVVGGQVRTVYDDGSVKISSLSTAPKFLTEDSPPSGGDGITVTADFRKVG